MQSAAVSLGVAIAVPLAVGLASGFITAKGVREWYPSLRKPSWTPPAWLFAPVWTALYVLMGGASWLAWRNGGSVWEYGVQLALNALWTAVFFGARSLWGGLVVIVALIAALVATIAAFWRVSAAAGAMLVPYLAWTSFATALNAALVAMN
jgi:translocator protein